MNRNRLIAVAVTLIAFPAFGDGGSRETKMNLNFPAAARSIQPQPHPIVPSAGITTVDRAPAQMKQKLAPKPPTNETFPAITG